MQVKHIIRLMSQSIYLAYLLTGCPMRCTAAYRTQYKIAWRVRSPVSVSTIVLLLILSKTTSVFIAYYSVSFYVFRSF